MRTITRLCSVSAKVRWIPDRCFDVGLGDIEHRRTQVRRPRTNGFVERFQRTVQEEFFETAWQTTLYESVEALQKDLDRWLVHYNTERPHQGYRNLGRWPLDTVQLYLDSVKKVA